MLTGNAFCYGTSDERARQNIGRKMCAIVDSRRSDARRHRVDDRRHDPTVRIRRHSSREGERVCRVTRWKAFVSAGERVKRVRALFLKWARATEGAFQQRCDDTGGP
jgi:hypothetical protein